MNKVKLYLEDLSCPDCARKITQVLNKLEGVTEAEVHYTTSKANVKYDEAEVTVEAMKQAVADTGYQVEKVR